MLKPFFFRIRSSRRDQQNDIDRFGRLRALIDETVAEVSAELEGLDRRYKSSQSDAALLLMASDNDDVSETQAQTRLESLESTILACEQRLQHLTRQEDMLRRMRAELETALLDLNISPHAPVKPAEA